MEYSSSKCDINELSGQTTYWKYQVLTVTIRRGVWERRLILFFLFYYSLIIHVLRYRLGTSLTCAGLFCSDFYSDLSSFITFIYNVYHVYTCIIHSIYRSSEYWHDWVTLHVQTYMQSIYWTTIWDFNGWWSIINMCLWY